MVNPLDFLTHLDVHLIELINNYGNYSYLLLAVIIFVEMGVIAFPFLPGDSLLFTLGGLAALPLSAINLPLLMTSLMMAAFLGYQFNYKIGCQLGTYILTKQVRWFNPVYLEKTHAFYEKQGGKALFLGRFLPIIRTFVPFVAGLGRMNAMMFILMNITSAIMWVMITMGCGYFLGELPFIKAHFSWVIYGIIIFSALPFFVSVWRTHSDR